jgi:hypothetical protein
METFENHDVATQAARRKYESDYDRTGVARKTTLTYQLQDETCHSVTVWRESGWDGFVWSAQRKQL